MDFKKSIQNFINSNFWESISTIAISKYHGIFAFFVFLTILLVKHYLKEKAKRNDFILQEKAKDNEISRLEKVSKIKTIIETSVSGTNIKYRKKVKKRSP